jgi:hypothetical protein
LFLTRRGKGVAMKYHFIPIALLVLFATSCGKEVPSGEFKVSSSSIIIGGLDWSEVTNLAEQSEEAVNAKMVAHIDLPFIGSRCTGFMINDDILMTNHHCKLRSRRGSSKGIGAAF